MTRHLSLRARLAVLTSFAVAVAVAACAVGCWFVVRGRLIDQLDQSLSRPGAGGPSGGGGFGGARDICDKPSQGGDDRFRQFLPTLQVVEPDGSSCSAQGATQTLKVAPSDIQVAQGVRGATFRDGETTDGTPMRVFTRPDPAGVAVSTARPLTQVTDSLNSLALLLVAVAAVGVLGAAVAGLLIARAGLKPVDRLTDAVEHIARTEDLATTIPEGGKDEIARLSRSFNSMTRALAGSRDRQQQLIVDAGHELRTPLTSLRTNVDLMLRSETTGRPLPPGDKARLLVNVKAQLVELSSLVGDLLDLSRAEAASSLGEVALHEVVDNAVRRARPRGPSIRIDAEVSPWYVRGDAASLERAFVNLLDNAVKFSPPGGTVTVRLDEGELTVTDEGPGIPAEDLRYVFDRFWRSPSARGLPGSGLGLAIAARAVRETGGEIRLGAAEGGGTSAWLRLPGTPAPAEPTFLMGG
ncbi:HAMP domain-containing sensor histidine kinase [Actinomadura sp. DC4]|uniref:HAMP domain-containing sensor histidine kinase n=1 Tax=Actinomadura sp. DC4 TaxID=3055069 RepID=UPI0025AFEFDF|nr:HAMP domain-containing sensor histidine kinase [Actinomadura sp. DC4]MDN3353508.1 HAMP domain-containing sensor histidine kinase [Actinomadura sp. DC4]